MIAQALQRKTVCVATEDWWGDPDPVPVVTVAIFGPQYGRLGWAVLTPENAEHLADGLRRHAAAARSRLGAASADRVAATLGYPPEFGSRQ